MGVWVSGVEEDSAWSEQKIGKSCPSRVLIPGRMAHKTITLPLSYEGTTEAGNIFVIRTQTLGKTNPNMIRSQHNFLETKLVNMLEFAILPGFPQFVM